MGLQLNMTKTQSSLTTTSQKEIAFYLTKLNKYGFSLDSKHEYTKSYSTDNSDRCKQRSVYNEVSFWQIVKFTFG